LKALVSYKVIKKGIFKGSRHRQEGGKTTLVRDDGQILTEREESFINGLPCRLLQARTDKEGVGVP
jgi:hypothetical protein